MSAMASQITSLTIVYPSVYSGADQRKHQSSASLAFVRGIHRSPVNSPHKSPVTRKMFPFDDVSRYIATSPLCSDGQLENIPKLCCSLFVQNWGQAMRSFQSMQRLYYSRLLNGRGHPNAEQPTFSRSICVLYSKVVPNTNSHLHACISALFHYCQIIFL